MKNPDEKTNALPCCQVDEIACHDCRYFGQPFCASVALKDAQEKIRQLKAQIDQMHGDCGACKLKEAENQQLKAQIDRMFEQMHGDCGVCKHKEAIGAPCVGCLTSRRNRPAWEYEGLPEDHGKEHHHD